MKIGILAQQEVQIRRPPYDGPANHFRHIVQALQSFGHHVRVLVSMEGGLWRTDDLEHYAPVVVGPMDHGPIRWFESGVRRLQYELQLPYAALFESVRFALACRQELRGYDLLYERMSWVSYGSALASRWMGVPLVLEYNGDHLADLEAKGIAPRGLQRRLSMERMAWAVRQAAHVIATGEGWRDQFLRRWQIPADLVTTVENGTDLVGLLEREQLRSFRTEYTPGGEVTVVYVGGFLPWHGVMNLARAVAGAREQGAPVRLLLIGSGQGLDEARQLVAEYHLEQHVIFAGRLTTKELAPYLADADIGASPYCGWQEFSGLKILDYKAAGLPTIASGQDGRPATVRHGETGWIVPPCDEDALLSAIVGLAGDQALRRRMGRSARLEAEACHGWDQTARQIERILNQVLTIWHPS